MFVDSHAHLQWKSFDKDRTLVIKRAKKENVSQIINVSVDIKSCNRSIELANQNIGLYATVGIHPHNATKINESNLRELKKLAKNQKVVAWGEIGLDYYRNISPKQIQKQAFEIQLLLAIEQNLPVIIHNRDAELDILDIINKYKNKISGVMHCFSGDKIFAKKSIELGFLISIAGPVTYPKAHNLHEIIKWLDLKDILIETDCPWLAPQSMRGKRNEPSYLPVIAEKIAELKQLTVEEVAYKTTENARKMFNII